MHQKTMGGMLVKKSLRLILRMVVIVLQVAAAFASEKPSKPRYSSLTAQHLHDENLISDAEYGKSVFRGD